MSKVYTYSNRPESPKERYLLAYQCVRICKLPIYCNDTYMVYVNQCNYYDIPVPINIAAYDSYRNRHIGINNSSLLDRLFDRLVDKYAEEIRESFNWDYLKSLATDTLEDNLSDFGEASSTVYLGSVFDLYPSGKYLHCLGFSNWDDIEAMKDRAYSDALDHVAGEYGGFIESGDSDPTDIYFGINWD